MWFEEWTPFPGLGVILRPEPRISNICLSTQMKSSKARKLVVLNVRTCHIGYRLFILSWNLLSETLSQDFQVFSNFSIIRWWNIVGYSLVCAADCCKSTFCYPATCDIYSHSSKNQQNTLGCTICLSDFSFEWFVNRGTR